MAVGGDINEITYQHPELGNGRFFPLANQGNTFDPGGIRTSDDEGGIAGNGELVLQKNRIRSSFEVIIVNDMNIREDARIAQSISESSALATFTFALINGTVWRGQGTIVGDIKTDVNTTQMSLKFAMGTLEKIQG
jgi:hypothetical protein